MRDDEFRQAYPQLWAWYDVRYPKAAEPRRSLLVLALVRRFSELHILASEESRNRIRDIEAGDPSDFTFTIVKAITELYKAAGIGRFTTLDSEIDELMSYVRDPKFKEDALVLAGNLQAKGFNLVEVVSLLPRLTSRLAHRPVSTRIETVKAAELHDAGYSWARVALKLRPGGSPDEIARAKESIRKSVKSLDKVFHKFVIPIPPRKSRR